MSDPYLLKNSTVLRNLAGLKTNSALTTFERRATKLRQEELLMYPITGDFNLRHLQAIHFYLFQDVYDWAGEIRTVDIAKSNLFCRVMYIEPQAAQIFDSLKNERNLADLDRNTFIRRLAFYFAEINALHPFREGNGRSTREFIRELALINGYVIDWTQISKDELIEASIAGFATDYRPMETLVTKILTPTENTL